MLAHRLGRPRGTVVSTGRHDAWSNLGLAVVGVTAAAVAGWSIVEGPTLLALALCGIPVLALLFNRPVVALFLLGATLTATESIPGIPASYNAALSDVLLMILLGIILARWATLRAAPELRWLRPVAPALLPYAAMMAVLLATHPGVPEALQSVQRLELFAVPAIVGAFAFSTGRHMLLLKAYIVSSAVLAVAWPLGILFEGQKNPVGQLIGNAILLILGVPGLRRFVPLLAVLAPGLFVTQSRGAILATALGVVILMLVQRVGLRSVVARTVPLAVVAAVAFVMLPGEARDRITTLSPGKDSRAAYALYIRQQLADDADTIIAAHPWTGVGIGNYAEAASGLGLVAVEDPHQVLLLEAAEGGYLLAAAFVLMIGGVAWVLVRGRRVPLAAVTAAIFVGTAVHGLVDVYWVRGTPVLGWLLVGMVCAARAAQPGRPDAT